MSKPLPRSLQLALYFLGLSLYFTACTKQPSGFTPASTARVVSDTAYGADPSQKMDIYLPKGRSTARTKVIVLVHGGAWSSGDKKDIASFIPMIQSRWPECAVVNINYRLANGRSVTAAQQLEDMGAAIHFLAISKKELNISDQMSLAGISAGAQLSLLYTYTRNTNNYVKCVADLYGPCIIDDWEWYNSYQIFLGKSIKDVLVNYTGKTWETDSSAYHRNSPYRQLSAVYAKPTIIFHGNADLVVPVYQSQWLSAKLKSLNVASEYHEYSFEGHGFSAERNEDCINKTIAFFREQLK